MTTTNPYGPLVSAYLAACETLPAVLASPAPWSLAGSGRSVNLPDGGKVRQEAIGRNKADQARARANARAIAGAGSALNIHHESLFALCSLLDAGAPRTPAIDETLAILAQAIAWQHDAPDHGRALFAALELKLDTQGCPAVLTADNAAAWM